MDDRPETVRRRLGVGGELALAALPTITVLVVMIFVDRLTEQRLLFASLAASAFLIYLDPHHHTNRVRTLMLAQSMAALVGWGANALIGSSYAATATAMIVVIVAMIALDIVHPPAVATTLSFSLRARGIGNVALFGLALGVTVILVLVQQGVSRLLGRLTGARQAREPENRGGARGWWP